MQIEGVIVCGDCYVGSLRFRTGEEGGDVGGERLQGVRGFGVVVGEQQVAYPVVEGVVQTSLALEGVSLAQCAILQQQLDDLVVATETSLMRNGYWGPGGEEHGCVPESGACSRACPARSR